MKLSEAEWDEKTPKKLVNPIPAPFQWCWTRWSRCNFQLRKFWSCFLLEAREKLSLGVVIPCQRQDRGESCDPVQIGLSFWGPLWCAASGRTEASGTQFPLTHDLLTSPSRNQPSVVLMPDYSPTEAKLSGGKPLLSHCLEPALVPLLCRDFMSSCPMVFGGGQWLGEGEEGKENLGFKFWEETE